MDARYAALVGEKLRNAYNDKKDIDVVEDIIADADERVASEAPTTRATFWEAVEKSFYSGSLLLQKQDNTALHRMMKEIERILAERKKQ